MKRIERENIRVEVTPRQPGDYGFGHIGLPARPADEEIRLCEEIAREIRRHVDDLGRSSVIVQWDNVPYCDHCGSSWTEGDSPHNGGCCDADIAALEASG